MNVQAQSLAMKPSGVARKPITRKSVSSSSPPFNSPANFANNDVSSGLIPVSTLEGYAPVELPASPVPSSPHSIARSSISSFTPSFGRQAVSPNLTTTSPVPQNVGGQTYTSGLIPVHTAPPNTVQSNGQGGMIGGPPLANSSALAQPSSNHARRMQRRNMMMNVTATVGSTQNSVASSPALSPGFISPPTTGAPSPQPPNISVSQAANTTLVARPIQAGMTAQWGHQTQNQPASLAAAVSRPATATRQSLPASSAPPVAGLGVSLQLGGGTNQLQMSAQTQRPMSMQPSGAAPQRHNTEPQIPSSLTIAYKPQRHSTAVPIQVSSPVQMKPPNQRTMSIQSTLTVASNASTLSNTNSASSPSSPLTTLTTPSTMYSPINQVVGAETIRRPPASELGKAASYFSLCDACKKDLTQGASFFECLICASGNGKVRFCIYCYTTGAAAGGHSHDPKYYICATDPLSPDAVVSTDTWTVRKNAMNLIWYQHVATGYKTYVRPQPTLVTGLPLGWVSRLTADGATYYYHSKTEKTSWTRPGKKLPDGWKETKTPDGKSFYVHTVLELCTWSMPGQVPDELSGQSNVQVTVQVKPGVPSQSPGAGQKPIQKKAVVKVKKTSQPLTGEVKIAAAVAGVETAAKWGTIGSDIASDPIAGTTKAVLLAAKTMKNNKQAKKMLAKMGMKNMKNMGKFAGAAMGAVGDDDMDLGGDDDGEEEGDEGEEGESHEVEDVEADDGVEEATAMETADFNANGEAGYEDPSAEPGYTETEPQGVYEEGAAVHQEQYQENAVNHQEAGAAGANNQANAQHHHLGNHPGHSRAQNRGASAGGRGRGQTRGRGQVRGRGQPANRRPQAHPMLHSPGGQQSMHNPGSHVARPPNVQPQTQTQVAQTPNHASVQHIPQQQPSQNVNHQAVQRPPQTHSGFPTSGQQPPRPMIQSPHGQNVNHQAGPQRPPVQPGQVPSHLRPVQNPQRPTSQGVNAQQAPRPVAQKPSQQHPPPQQRPQQRPQQPQHHRPQQPVGHHPHPPHAGHHPQNHHGGHHLEHHHVGYHPEHHHAGHHTEHHHGHHPEHQHIGHHVEPHHADHPASHEQSDRNMADNSYAGQNDASVGQAGPSTDYGYGGDNTQTYAQDASNAQYIDPSAQTYIENDPAMVQDPTNQTTYVDNSQVIMQDPTANSASIDPNAQTYAQEDPASTQQYTHSGSQIYVESSQDMMLVQQDPVHADANANADMNVNANANATADANTMYYDPAADGVVQPEYGGVQPSDANTAYAGEPAGYEEPMVDEGQADYGGEGYGGEEGGYQDPGYNGEGYEGEGYEGEGYDDAGYEGEGYDDAGYEEAQFDNLDEGGRECE